MEVRRHGQVRLGVGQQMVLAMGFRRGHEVQGSHQQRDLQVRHRRHRHHHRRHQGLPSSEQVQTCHLSRFF